MPIVEAVMCAVNVGSIEGEPAERLRKALEAAEVAAVEQCVAEGISLYDADVIRARKADARAAAMEAFYAS